jgi:hypothetical protein
VAWAGADQPGLETQLLRWFGTPSTNAPTTAAR